MISISTKRGVVNTKCKNAIGNLVFLHKNKAQIRVGCFVCALWAAKAIIFGWVPLGERFFI